MSGDEYRTHMSLWAILAAPLLAGNDIRNMTPDTKSILMNAEVTAINQDKGGTQGKRIWQQGDQEIWVRELANGDRVIGAFNRGGAAVDLTLRWADLGFKKAPKKARNLWAHSDTEIEGTEYKVSVPMHGVVFLRVK
jgi:alpha-galactosidase